MARQIGEAGRPVRAAADMIRFAANATSWDTDLDRMIPGGMGDRMIAPILHYLDPDAYTVGRMPEKGAVNAYLTTPSVYQGGFIGGENAVLTSHGIADKNIRSNPRRVQHFRWVIVPGPKHTERLMSSGVQRRQIVELGYPKLDWLFTRPRIPRPPGGKVRVLYAPTHGGGGETKHMHDTAPSGSVASRSTSWWHRDQVIAALRDRVDLTVCPHPRHRDDRQATYNEYLAADVVIADGGSTMWEAWALGIPVVFPTWISGGGNTARRTSLEAFVYRRRIGKHADFPEQLADLCEMAAGSGIGTQASKLIESVFPAALRGSSGRAHAEFLFELNRKLIPSRSRSAASRTRSAA